MSGSKVMFSPKGAFSFRWNKSIDDKDFFFFRLGKSVVVFFRTLFCKYAVYKSEVNPVFNSENHGSSVFFKECRKIMEEFKVEQANVSINENNQEFFEDKNNELVSPKKLNEEMILYKKLETLMESENFENSDHYFSEDNLRLLGSEYSLLLFESALAEDCYEIALRLLSTKDCVNFVDISDDDKTDTLSFFIECGYACGVKYLLENGLVDMNARDEDGDTPVMIAVLTNEKECLEILLKYGASINDICGEEKMTPLYAAVSEQFEECMDVLLGAEKTDVNFKNEDGNTALHCAAEMGNVMFLRKLVACGARNEKNNKGYTALHWAAGMSTQCLNVLLKGGGDVNVVDSDGCTALHWAAKNNKIDAIKVLLSEDDVEVSKKVIKSARH